MKEKVLIDTNIVIQYLQGEYNFVKYLDEKIKEGVLIFMSTISVAELYSKKGITREDVDLIDHFVMAINLVPCDYLISRTAGFLRQNLKIKTPDAVIAATSICMDAKLVTENGKDFKGVTELDLEIISR